MTRRSKRKQKIDKVMDGIFDWYGFTFMITAIFIFPFVVEDISIGNLLWWWFGVSSAFVVILFIPYILTFICETIQKFQH